MVLGILCIAVGAILAYFWLEAFIIALQGAVIFGLLFFGTVTLLIAVSRRKAHREFKTALQDETGDGDNSAA